MTVRIRTQFPDWRKALLRSIGPPAKTVVAVRHKSDFAVAHYTAQGPVDDDNFSVKILSKYVEELSSYSAIVEYVRSALLFVSGLSIVFSIALDTIFTANFVPLHDIRFVCGGATTKFRFESVRTSCRCTR